MSTVSAARLRRAIGWHRPIVIARSVAADRATLDRVADTLALRAAALAESARRVVCIDFDGTMTEQQPYRPGVASAPPRRGLKAVLQDLRDDGFRVVVLTARPPSECYGWLAAHGVLGLVDAVTNTKPPAIAYIDDRAVHFDGNWPAALAHVRALMRAKLPEPVAGNDAGSGLHADFDESQHPRDERGRFSETSSSGERPTLTVYKTRDDVKEISDWGEKKWQWKNGTLAPGAPIERSSLPPVLYHATTRLDALGTSAMLKAQHGDRGLGGGTSDGVSLTTSRADAELIAVALRRAHELVTDRPESEDALREHLTKYARADERAAKIPEGSLQRAVDQAVYNYHVNMGASASNHPDATDTPWAAGTAKDAFSMYLQIRRTDGQKAAFGDSFEAYKKMDASDSPLKNPLLFSGVDALRSVDPRHIGIVSVPVKSIPESALLMPGDDYLHEVRVHADVPLGGAAWQLAASFDAAAEPTEAQKAAGNYRKDHIRVFGMEIAIENRAGSVRRGPDWSQRMAHDYGYFNGSKGADKDHVDVFVASRPIAAANDTVYIINQLTDNGAFDEHKCMLGFPNESAARRAYLQNYPAGWASHIGSIRALSLGVFKAWLYDGVKRLAAVSDFDENQHPRDEHGRFTDSSADAELVTVEHGTETREMREAGNTPKGYAKRAPGGFAIPPPPPEHGESPVTHSPAFKSWFKQSKVVDDNGEPMRVYHGTTGTFKSFDLSLSNPESDWGAGLYFSNSPEDITKNYAGEGPDLTSKLQHRAEQLAQEFDDDPQSAPKSYDPNASDEDKWAFTRNVARQELHVEHGGATLPVYLSLQNPVIIGGEHETYLDYEQKMDEDGEYTDDESGKLVDVVMALRSVASEYHDVDIDKTVAAAMGDDYYDGGVSARKFVERAKDSEGLSYATDDEGRSVSGEIIRRAFEEAGFDGVIDYSVNEKFGSEKKLGRPMEGMDEDTVHYIAFKPEQVKSAIGNRGTFDPNDPDIAAAGDNCGTGAGGFQPDNTCATGEGTSYDFHDVSLRDVLDDPKSPGEIRAALTHFKARPITLKTGETIWRDGDSVIEWDGKELYTSITNAAEWVHDQDVFEQYPDYGERFNDDFWSAPAPLFHATTEESADEIEQSGLEARNESRGIGNRGTGPAVFTTSEASEAADGAYGDVVFVIDTAAMKRDGHTPYVSEEEPWVENELRSALAHQIGLHDFEPDDEAGISPYTVVLFGDVPAKYLRRATSHDLRGSAAPGYWQTLRLRAARDFDESQHPRDELGKFTDSGGGTSDKTDSGSRHAVETTSVPIERLQTPHARETLQAIYGRTGELVDHDTLHELKVYPLQPLVNDPTPLRRMLDELGYKVEYFAFENDSATGVQFRVPNLKTKGYEQGYVWLYDPRIAAGSFEDTAYTNAWRVAHEVGHAISEPFMAERYGTSKREGRLGQPMQGVRGNPDKKQVPVELRAMTLGEAQRAVEWEDVAFRTQRALLSEYAKIEISDKDFAREYNTNLTDAVYRVMTGSFGDPGKYGYRPATERANLRDVLTLLERQEHTLATAQGRAPTKGIDLSTWREIGDEELRNAIRQRRASTGAQAKLAAATGRRYRRAGYTSGVTAAITSVAASISLAGLTPTAARLTHYLAIFAADFDESLHPRDEAGRFTDGGGGSAPSSVTEHRPADISAPTEHEVTVPPPPGKFYAPDPLADADHDSVTDAARVGVPADQVPPPPAIPRLPNLTADERRAESTFAGWYENDPDGAVHRLLTDMQAGKISDAPNIFATDEAKMLSGDWNPNRDGVSDDERKAAKALYNTAVHQTANALTKRAFQHYLDTVVAQYPEGDQRRSVLITAGGCGAGKGYALGKVEAVSSLQGQVGAVWDSAGEQNSTELPWVTAEAEKRGLTVYAAYVHADPKETWASPKKGVVERAQKKGRMVDARVFVDSYVIGAKNFAAWQKTVEHNANIKTVVIDNRTTPVVVPSMPAEALGIDSEPLYHWAIDYVQKSNVAPAIKRAATGGMRIWK